MARTCVQRYPSTNPASWKRFRLGLIRRWRRGICRGLRGMDLSAFACGFPCVILNNEMRLPRMFETITDTDD